MGTGFMPGIVAGQTLIRQRLKALFLTAQPIQFVMEKYNRNWSQHITHIVDIGHKFVPVKMIIPGT